MQALVGLLMQYPSGGIRPIRTGRRRFVLLPRYERGGWHIQWWLSERNWLVVADIVARRVICHRGMTFLLLEPQ